MAISVNYQYYENPGVAEEYGSKCFLIKAEEVILQSLKQEVSGQDLLEIGIGGGRITSRLLAMTKNYTGIDFSKRMIEQCQQKFDSSFFVCDARNLALFRDEQFSAIVFWGNGIDEVSPSDRMLILKEANRVLKRNGIFTFSSHNLEWNAIPSYLLEGFSLSRKALRDNATRVLLYMRCAATRLWSRIWRKGYLVIVEYDEPLRLAMPMYFIEENKQVQQLLEAGFQQPEVLASDGSRLDDDNRHQDFLVFYTARKQ